MGREVRRVPSDWEHPRYTKDTARRREEIGHFVPLYDLDFETAAREWEEQYGLWLKGEHPSQLAARGKERQRLKAERFWEHDSPPDREHYRERAWATEEATHFQVYETVSEGTPVTPHFAAKGELIEYLVEKGDYWDQTPSFGAPRRGWSRKGAEDLVRYGDAPSLAVNRTSSGTQIHEARDGRLPELDRSTPEGPPDP